MSGETYTSRWVAQSSELDEAPRPLTEDEITAAARLAHQHAANPDEEAMFRALLGIDQHDRQEVPA